MQKELLFNDEARGKLLAGADKLANAVKVTLGPRGRNVAFDRVWGIPAVTKDGVTVARSIELSDPTESMGAKLLLGAAMNTVSRAGDGTTTATVLAQKIMHLGSEAIKNGANPISIKRGIDRAAADAVASIGRLSIGVPEDPTEAKEYYRNVAFIASNGDKEIADVVAETMSLIGPQGFVTIDESNAIKTEVITSLGIRFPSGILRPEFINNRKKLECELENTLILLYDGQLRDFNNELAPLMNMIIENNKSLVNDGKAPNALLIICDKLDDRVLANFSRNTTARIDPMTNQRFMPPLFGCIVKNPKFGQDNQLDFLGDVAALTGATVLSENGIRLRDFQPGYLGLAEKAVISAGENFTSIIKGNGIKKNIDERIEEVRSKLTVAKDEYEEAILKERLGKLSGGIANIRVGATTEVEMREKKDRYEDAILAAKAAQEEGIVPGGGVAYFRLAELLGYKPIKKSTGAELTDDELGELMRANTSKISVPNKIRYRDPNPAEGQYSDDDITGYNILANALIQPIRQIAENGGFNPDSIIGGINQFTDTEIAKKVVANNFLTDSYLDLRKNHGFDADKEVFCDMIEAKIIDPAKVVHHAIENAASVAGTILTIEATNAIAGDTKQLPPGPLY